MKEKGKDQLPEGQLCLAKPRVSFANEGLVKVIRASPTPQPPNPTDHLRNIRMR
jgi:hypothetical protein